MDFGRYLIDLVVFVGITVVLMFSFHLLVLWRTERIRTKLSRQGKRLGKLPQPGCGTQSGSGRLVSVPDRA
ncbi:hypothetical protein [Arthrobacter bambusae]|uniref:hypothetical protein n=1 Tax=Arthrobacter bambusae TaxID=1338426 RepID=UPI00277D3534|nr:hypothetical protein [Arthrobacter bambusae]MDQ0031365.1 hypothetical protein [Arthrobacter bambusae]MDQ0099588.1 hypothetical protein [Arthrobacter bambusae]